MVEKFAVVAIRAERDENQPEREKAFVVVDSMNDVEQAENYIETKRHQYPEDMAFEIVPASTARTYVAEANAPPAPPAPADTVIENQ